MEVATGFQLCRAHCRSTDGQEMLIRNAWDKSSLSTVSIPHLQDKSLSVNHFRVSLSMSVSYRQHPGGSPCHAPFNLNH